MHYHNITKDDMLNGDGLRVVLWTAGCKHGCKGCHNPVTWDADGEYLLTKQRGRRLQRSLRKAMFQGSHSAEGTRSIPETVKRREGLSGK